MIRDWGRCGTPGLMGSLLLLLSGCGGQFEAVQATSAAGQRVAVDEHVLATIPALCLEVASLSGASDDCAGLRDQARGWGYAVGQVDAYARALARQASQGYVPISPEMLPEPPAGGASAGLKPDQQAAAATLGSVTRELLLHRRDDAVLKKAIGDADGPIQLLVAAVRGAVDQRIATIDLAETSIDVVRQRLEETVAGAAGRPSAPHQAEAAPAAAAKKPDKAASAREAEFELMRPTLEAVGGQLSALHDTMRRQAVANQATVPGAFAGLAAVQHDLESTRERFVHLRDTLDVFARAHGSLRENVDRIDTDALLEKVLGIISEPGAPPPKPAPPHPS